MPMAELDHLIVAADTLERGIAHIDQCLGVACQPGGQHPGLGTHNALVRLGRQTYIEVIAIDPVAPEPTVPRWFGLDDPGVRACLGERPRLLTWVARTPDLEEAIGACRHDPGEARPMRRGDLCWQIAFPANGQLLEGGLVPPLIEWADMAAHPALALPSTGLELEGMQATHPDPEHMDNLLAPLGLADAVKLGRDDRMAPSPGVPVDLQAAIATPAGRRWLT